MHRKGPTWVLYTYAVMTVLVFSGVTPISLLLGVFMLAGIMPVPTWLVWVPLQYLYVATYALPLSVGLLLVVLHARRYRYEVAQGWIEPRFDD